MREIKFRAWDGKTMTEGVQPLLENVNPTHCMVPELSMSIYEPSGRKRFWYEIEIKAIMQYTGLKDKNGKEIYEGDVVKCHDHPTGIYDGVGEVIFNCGYYSVKALLPPLHDYGTAWTEVIGNIYENPELLEQSE